MRETLLKRLKSPLNFTSLLRSILNCIILSLLMSFLQFKSTMTALGLTRQQTRKELQLMISKVRRLMLQQKEGQLEVLIVKVEELSIHFLSPSPAKLRLLKSGRIKLSTCLFSSCHLSLEFISALLFLWTKMLVSFSIQS